MIYTDQDCKNALEKDSTSMQSYCLIDSYEGSMNYSISFVKDGLLFDCLISNDDLAFACINFLVRNGNKVYKNLNEFKKENPDVIC